MSADEAALLRSQYRVVSSRLKAGLLQVKVVADAPPPAMTPAAPTLEDVYFAEPLLEHGLAAHLD
ncbi:MAG: hypothetical protein QM736_00420 [Vicinamibacterales bacterium]